MTVLYVKTENGICLACVFNLVLFWLLQYVTNPVQYVTNPVQYVTNPVSLMHCFELYSLQGQIV